MHMRVFLPHCCGGAHLLMACHDAIQSLRHGVGALPLSLSVLPSILLMLSQPKMVSRGCLSLLDLLALPHAPSI